MARTLGSKRPEPADAVRHAVSHAERYDRKYFDRWYRDRRQRVFTTQERARRAALAVAATEYVLGRRIRSVLDVGAGEGHWRAPLLALRPRCRYLGLDPSPYVVKRFGKSRNIRLGSIETLDPESFGAQFDLVLAVGFLNLLQPRSLARAIRQIRPLVGGVVLLEIFTSADPLTGDVSRYHLAPPATYRRMLSGAGLVDLGFHLYAPEAVAGELASLERR